MPSCCQQKWLAIQIEAALKYRRSFVFRDGEQAHRHAHQNYESIYTMWARHMECVRSFTEVHFELPAVQNAFMLNRACRHFKMDTANTAVAYLQYSNFVCQFAQFVYLLSRVRSYNAGH